MSKITAVKITIQPGTEIVIKGTTHHIRLVTMGGELVTTAQFAEMIYDQVGFAMADLIFKGRRTELRVDVAEYGPIPLSLSERVRAMGRRLSNTFRYERSEPAPR